MPLAGQFFFPRNACTRAVATIVILEDGPCRMKEGLTLPKIRFKYHINIFNPHRSEHLAHFWEKGLGLSPPSYATDLNEESGKVM